MKTHLLTFAFALATVLTPLAARAEDEIDFNFFYENLSPYGEWIQVGDYGNCWVPSGVDDEWSPYTDGYWSYTDAGWTWISYEDFGDITYHYGRWVRADDVGWCWVPDYEWGPAWVSWREEEEHIGWAPLPPEAHWNVSVGFSTWSDDYYDIGPTCYNFVPVVHFGAPVLRYHCLPRYRVVSIFGHSHNITNICWNPGSRFVFCGGPRYGYYNARLSRPIPTFKIVRNNVVNNYNTTIIKNKKVVRVNNKIEGNTLRVFSPKVAKKTTNELVQPKVTRVVAKDKVNKGWRPGAKDKDVDTTQLTKLREKVRDEAKTTNPEKAPARPVEVADLDPVPKKADPTAKSPVADRVKRPAKDDDKPNKIAGPQGDDQPNRPNGKPDGDKPNKVAGDRPNKVPGDDKPNRPQTGVEADKPGQGPAVNDDKPNRVADRPDNDNPLKKPFRQQGDDREPGMKGQPKADNNGPNKNRDNDAEQGQRAAREQQEKQVNAQREAQQREAQQRRAAEMENERKNNAVNEARQRQAAQLQAENAQRQRAQQQQAIQAQRQQQAQRQIQAQRQQQQARQQPAQGGGGGQRQGGGQGQGGGQAQGGGQGQGQGQGQGGGGKGKGQLSPEELQQLRKQQR